MNRELKFRVWDPATKVFQYFTLRNAMGHVPNDIPDSHICQYTGLKDKNGKEIYEGDVMRAWHDFGPGGFHLHTCPVIWDVHTGYQWEYWDLPTIEIIGNIFENPELIRK